MEEGPEPEPEVPAQGPLDQQTESSPTTSKSRLTGGIRNRSSIRVNLSMRFDLDEPNHTNLDTRILHSNCFGASCICVYVDSHSLGRLCVVLRAVSIGSDKKSATRNSKSTRQRMPSDHSRSRCRSLSHNWSRRRSRRRSWKRRLSRNPRIHMAVYS